MNTFFFELCAESLQAARIAEAGGADRVELCHQLSAGGITPDFATMVDTVRAVSIPVHMLIRPRAGNFVYNDTDFTLIREQTLQAKTAGAAGVAIGLLLPDGRVDVKRTREIAELAAPLKITFHRAFDKVLVQDVGLEDVIAAGADCLLTSGGKANVLEGADQISALREQAGNRITIMAGGGLSLSNMLEVARKTGVTYLHGSLIRKAAKSPVPAAQTHATTDSISMGDVFLEDVKLAISRLNDAFQSEQVSSHSSQLTR
ncbi:copper homeostasis protein CutC [Acidicapsa ligni]|uniref:copper homeostasis protein CutC n=1 Tax=Acidicapsa ligni TaxID=542300 RepID=UPI0021DF6A7C|nr:copper homeostasis protein CutC [Acidicapsa ligni]